MANEAVIIELLGDKGDVVRYTIADNTGIPKGTLMQLSSDPRTITAGSAHSQIFVGITSTEKVADDGQTTIGVYTNGIFDLKDDGSTMTLGDVCQMTGANLVGIADEAGALAPREVVGLVLETTGASEVVAVKVRAM
jgi:hypothetical protein